MDWVDEQTDRLVSAKIEATRQGYLAGREDRKGDFRRNNPYPPGDLADLWAEKYMEALRGW